VDFHPRQQQHAGLGPRESQEGVERGTSQPEDDSEESSDVGSALDAIESVFEQVPAEERAQLAEVVLAASRTASWSGILPPPGEFRKYSPEVQERMLSWNDSFTSDESARQDKLVAAEVAEAERGPRRSLWVVFTCLGLAALSIFWEDNVAGARDFAHTEVRSQSSRDDASSEGRSQREPERGD